MKKRVFGIVLASFVLSGCTMNYEGALKTTSAEVATSAEQTTTVEQTTTAEQTTTVEQETTLAMSESYLNEDFADIFRKNPFKNDDDFWEYAGYSPCYEIIDMDYDGTNEVIIWGYAGIREVIHGAILARNEEGLQLIESGFHPCGRKGNIYMETMYDYYGAGDTEVNITRYYQVDSPFEAFVLLAEECRTTKHDENNYENVQITYEYTIHSIEASKEEYEELVESFGEMEDIGYSDLTQETLEKNILNNPELQFNKK